MLAIREDASRVIIKPRAGYPSLIHTIMKFMHDDPINTLSPGLDELMAHLAALPSYHLRLNLDELVDEYLAEFEPVNALAQENIAWYRAAPRKEYEAFIQVDEPGRKAEITLNWLKPG